MLVATIRRASANEAYVASFLQRHAGFDSFTLEYLQVLGRPAVQRSDGYRFRGHSSTCSARLRRLRVNKRRALSHPQVARPALFRLSVGRDIEPVICWLRWVGLVGRQVCWWVADPAPLWHMLAQAGIDGRRASLTCLRCRLSRTSRACTHPVQLSPLLPPFCGQEHWHQRAAAGGACAAHPVRPQVGLGSAPQTGVEPAPLDPGPHGMPCALTSHPASPPTCCSCSVDDQLEPLAAWIASMGGDPSAVLNAYPGLVAVPVASLKGTRHVLRQLGAPGGAIGCRGQEGPCGIVGAGAAVPPMQHAQPNAGVVLGCRIPGATTPLLLL